jgi:hypothetical protein
MYRASIYGRRLNVQAIHVSTMVKTRVTYGSDEAIAFATNEGFLKNAVLLPKRTLLSCILPGLE